MPAPNIPGDPNAIKLSEYKGDISRCRYCTADERMLGRACTRCMGQGYLATCLNCRGTGKFTGSSVWDGGRSSHTSTCNICGGQGTFPAREQEYINWVASNPVADGEEENADIPLREPLQPVKPMPNTRMR